MKKGKYANSPMDAALDFLSGRARSVREVEEKLDSLNFGEADVSRVIDRLIELKYLDDYKYAEDFVYTRLATKPISRKKLYMQLYAHKLPKDAINAALDAVTQDIERKNAMEIAEKFDKQFASLDVEERKQRVIRRLMGRGFDYQAAREAIESIYGDASGIDFSSDDEEDDA